MYKIVPRPETRVRITQCLDAVGDSGSMEGTAGADRKWMLKSRENYENTTSDTSET